MDEDAADAGDGQAAGTGYANAAGVEDAEDDGTGEVTLTRMGLREGGWIGYTDGAIFIDRDGETKVKVDHANVTQISLRTVEWDLAVLSLVLVGVGTYVAATRNPLVGIGFGAVGCWSCYRTYNERYELHVHVEGRHKPLAVHPVEPKECHETLADVVGLQRRDES